MGKDTLNATQKNVKGVLDGYSANTEVASTPARLLGEIIGPNGTKTESRQLSVRQQSVVRVGPDDGDMLG